MSSSALADEVVAECASAYVQAQMLQKEGKYLDAAKMALSCSKPSCGDALSGECAKLYDVIQNATPSVVFAAKDGDDNDLSNVKVFADGKLVREKLDGNPLALDPGVHVFRFETANVPVVEKPYTVRAGEKLRIVSETLGQKRMLQRVNATETPLPPPPPSVSPRALRISGGVVLGIGAVALGGFGLFRALGSSEYDDLKNTCSPRCATDAADSSKMKYTLSYASLGVGIAAVATSVVLFSMSAGGSSTVNVRVVPKTGGGFGEIVAQF
jgi:nitrogen fixation-related uncharacterized protein